MGKTKIMVSGLDLDLLKKSGKNPYGVCQKGVCSNAISCGGCLCWIHKKCNMTSRGPLRPLRPDPDFRCAQCLGTARPIDGRTVKGVKVDKEKLKAISRVLLSRRHALCWRWLRADCCNMLQMWLGPVPQTALPSH